MAWLSNVVMPPLNVQVHARLCFIYKIVHGLLYFPPNVVVASRALSHSPHLYILHQPFALTNSYMYSFVPSTISKWNMLPDYVFPPLHLAPLNTNFLSLPCNRVHCLIAIATCILVAFSTEIRKKVIYKTNLALQAPAESYTEHMKHTQAKSHNSKRLQSDRRENTQQSSRGAKRWHYLEVHCLYHSLPLAVIFYR